jgi:hypothetical protein
MEEVKEAEEQYQPLVDHRAQNSSMMFQCIMQSISTKVLTKVSIKSSPLKILEIQNIL